MTSEYRAFALEIGGLFKADKRLHFSGGRVHFKAGRVAGAFWVVPWGRNRSGGTHLQYGWSPRHRLFLRPEGFFDPIAKGLGLQDLKVGNARFDRAFLIQGSPSATVLRALGPETQTLLLRLSKLAKGRGPTLQINEEGTYLRLSCETPRKDWGKVVELGNAIMRTFTPKAEDEPCSLCAKAIAGRSRRCRGCKSLYHRKCWEARGGCDCP